MRRVVNGTHDFNPNAAAVQLYHHHCRISRHLRSVAWLSLGHHYLHVTFVLQQEGGKHAECHKCKIIYLLPFDVSLNSLYQNKSQTQML